MRHSVYGNTSKWLTTGLVITLVLFLSTACGSKKEQESEPVQTIKQAEKIVDKISIGQFPHITDIHFNPFYDATLFEKLKAAPADQWEGIFAGSSIKTLGTYNDFSEETNYPLLNSAMVKMASVSQKPDFLIFTGDFIAHIFHDRYKKVNNNSDEGVDDFIQKTIAFYTLLFNKHFPGVPVYFCLGNNDSYAGDYLIVPEGPFLKNTAPLFAESFLQNTENKTSFHSTYPAGGYFSIKPTHIPNTKIISLNTIFFSHKFKTDFTAYNPADKEMEWFEQQLKSAQQNNEKVWLLIHIPPGTNVFSTLKKKTYKSDWIDVYNTRFMQLLTDYSSIIEASFAGHTHMDDFLVLLTDDTASNGASVISKQQALAFIHICPGISSLFGNNPGFQLFTYDSKAFSLMDYSTYYVDLSTNPTYISEDETLQQWKKEYNFKEAYGQDMISNQSMQTVFMKIKNDKTQRTHFINYYDVNHRKELNENNWKSYWCGIGHWTQDSFENCNQSGEAEKDNQ